MEWWSTRNLKRQMILLFAAYFLTSLLADAAAWFFCRTVFTELQMLAVILTIPLVLAAIFGFFIAQHMQRRMDRLQLGLIQIHKGNLRCRLQSESKDPFDLLYYQFNEMASSLEQRLKEFQQYGEADIASTSEANHLVMEERRRLARDLHDTVSQELFAMHMHASALPALLERNPDGVRPILEQLIQMSHLAQKQIRGLISQLRPLELEGKTLTEALDLWFPDYCRHNGMQGTLDLRIQRSIPEAKEHQMFMIIQEAMANVVKHASAKQVTLTVMESDHSFVLQISDDGVGFVQEVARRHSYGLSTMKERALKLGGELEVTSLQGTGTRVKVTIPKWD